jgi:hypothetical protein
MKINKIFLLYTASLTLGKQILDSLLLLGLSSDLSNQFNFFFFFFLWYWGLTSRPTPWATLPAHFLKGFFQDRVSWTICLGWLWTAILLISTSWAARITGASHLCPVKLFFLFNQLYTLGTGLCNNKWNVSSPNILPLSPILPR